MEANFVKEITVIDPDTKGKVKLEVYKHQNGGMFAIDSSYLEELENEQGEVSDCVIISDPFADISNPETLHLFNE